MTVYVLTTQLSTAGAQLLVVGPSNTLPRRAGEHGGSLDSANTCSGLLRGEARV
jgi:hypothetical protein